MSTNMKPEWFVCKTCGLEVPKEQFYPRKMQCKRCYSWMWHKKDRIMNRKKRNAQRKVYYHANKKRLLEQAKVWKRNGMARDPERYRLIALKASKKYIARKRKDKAWVEKRKAMKRGYYAKSSKDPAWREKMNAKARANWAKRMKDPENRKKWNEKNSRSRRKRRAAGKKN